MNSRTFGVLKKGAVLLLNYFDVVKELEIFLKPIVKMIIDKKTMSELQFHGSL